MTGRGDEASRRPARAARRIFGAALARLLLALLAAVDPAVAETLEVERSGRVMQVQANIEVDAPAGLCYAVLADFDRLADFVPQLESSQTVSRPGEPLRLRQVGRTSVAFSDYVIDVTLAVTVDPPRRIDFTRVAGNLERMDGYWQVAGDSNHCTIDYRAAIEPAFWVPPVIGPLLIRRQVERQLDGVVAEIARRVGSPADR